jgi:anti-sigma B factor antagonist
MDRATFDDEAYDHSGRIIAVRGELDVKSVGELRRRIQRAFAAGPPRLLIDLTGVSHIDSTGLAELISAHQRAMEMHGRLVLVIESAAIRRTFEIRGVVNMFAITDTRDAGRAALAQA